MLLLPPSMKTDWKKRGSYVTVRVTCAGTLCVCDTCVETLWFRRNVWKPAVLLFLGMGAITISNCRKVADASPGNNTCGRVVVFLFFGLSQSRTEHCLVHL